MLNKVWVYAEANGDKVTTATLELLTKAREIASTVEAVYAGSAGDAVATQVGEYGATTLYVFDPGKALAARSPRPRSPSSWVSSRPTRCCSCRATTAATRWGACP